MEKKSRTKYLKYYAYEKMLKRLEETEDEFEKDILSRILRDYKKNHRHYLTNFEKLLDEKRNLICPKCQSSHVVKNGKDRNGTVRLKCQDCGKNFSITSRSLFFSTKVNIRAWLVFLEGIISETSIKAACTNAKISMVTGVSWMKRVFKVLRNYQDNIVLNGNIYIDETYVHVDQSKIVYKDEIGKSKKVLKQPRGISINKIGILFATNGEKCFGEIINLGRPLKSNNYKICKKHITVGSSLIGDQDYSLTYAAKQLKLKRTRYKANTQEAYDNLKPIDQLCGSFKFFIDKHRGFKKRFLQDYINLFVFLQNEKLAKAKPHETVMKILKMLISYNVTDKDDDTKDELMEFLKCLENATKRH